MNTSNWMKFIVAVSRAQHIPLPNDLWHVKLPVGRVVFLYDKYAYFLEVGQVNNLSQSWQYDWCEVIIKVIEWHQIDAKPFPTSMLTFVSVIEHMDPVDLRWPSRDESCLQHCCVLYLYDSLSSHPAMPYVWYLNPHILLISHLLRSSTAIFCDSYISLFKTLPQNRKINSAWPHPCLLQMLISCHIDRSYQNDMNILSFQLWSPWRSETMSISNLMNYSCRGVFCGSRAATLVSWPGM